MKDNDTIIDVPLVDQFRDTEEEKWKSRSCGICAVKMMMVFKNSDLSTLPVDTLINGAVDLGGYIDNIGWRHQSLVDLARGYGVNLQFQKLFFRTQQEKEKGLKIIIDEIKTQKPVMTSVFRDFDPGKGGHLVVVRGLREDGKDVAGFYIQDPYSKDRGNNYFVSKDEFMFGWRGGLIWFSD